MYTTEEIHRLNFLREVEISLVDIRFPCEESIKIAAILPKNTKESWKNCIDWCISYVKTLNEDEAKNFYHSLPAGYLRMRIDDIIENKFNKGEK